MITITYGGGAFPCSREGVKPPARGFAATDWIKTCDLATLVTIGRPADEEVRRQWMRRVVANMHWLPMIEHPAVNTPLRALSQTCGR